MKYFPYISSFLLFISLLLSVGLFFHYQSLMGMEIGLAKVSAAITSLFYFGEPELSGYMVSTGIVNEVRAILNGLIVAIAVSIAGIAFAVGKRIVSGWYKLYSGLVCYGIAQIICIVFLIYNHEIWKIT